MKRYVIYLTFAVSMFSKVTLAQEIVQNSPMEPSMKAYESYESFICSIEINQSRIENLENKVSYLKQENFRKHPLGKEISILLQIVDDTYTYYTQPAPGEFSGRRIVQKPLIYNSVFQLDNHFRRAVRKNKISKEQAFSELKKILETSILIYEADTTALEELLKEKNSDNEAIHLFNCIEFQIV